MPLRYPSSRKRSTAAQVVREALTLNDIATLRKEYISQLSRLDDTLRSELGHYWTKSFAATSELNNAIIDAFDSARTVKSSDASLMTLSQSLVAAAGDTVLEFVKYGRGLLKHFNRSTFLRKVEGAHRPLLNDFQGYLNHVTNEVIAKQDSRNLAVQADLLIRQTLPDLIRRIAAIRDKFSQHLAVFPIHDKSSSFRMSERIIVFAALVVVWAQLWAGSCGAQ